ncbi:MAG: hypothetical protein ABFE08_01900 [Armatimonadia bacterium]
MLKACRLTLVSLTLLGVLAWSVSAQEKSAWVNARDCGASGSQYSTGAVTVAGSNQITVQDVGDFQVGQGVMVSRCNVRYLRKMLYGPKKVLQGSRALKDEVEMRGYDGAAGSWLIYVLDVAPGPNPSFRWSDDIGRTWHQGGPLDREWHALSGGTEVRFAPDKLDWTEGYAVTFSARDQLVTRIEKIEGKVLTLRDPANRSANDAVVRHCDNSALQDAIDKALKEKRNVFVPPGWYRLAAGLRIRNASSLTFEGASAENVTFDISEGEGACVTLSVGEEVNLRNFTMLGNTGFADADIAGYLNVAGAWGLWGMSLRPCNAVSISSTERVLVENCHARKMSCEAFVSGGNSRAVKPPGKHTISTTYLRCSAIDCGRNAFNDVLCGSENTSVLYCRIVDVGGCSWEGAGRFIRFIGNYVRNSGTVAMGNLGPLNHDETYPDLGAGQHIIADNVFEGGGYYGGKIGSCAVVTCHGSTQVIIRNNLFVNFNSPAIYANGWCDTRHYPAANTIITGNIVDLSCLAGASVPRCGVEISANETIAANNQIYVRGAVDPTVTGIRLREPALNVNVHDNLIRNCGTGIATLRAQGRVAEVIDKQTFMLPGSSGVPMVRAGSHGYRGWQVVWLQGDKAAGTSTIESCDPETFRFKLTQPRDMKVGDVLEIYPPYGANWDLHDNTISDCTHPVFLDSYGSGTSLFRGNTITRGGATGVKEALALKGRFTVVDNTFSGFDEAGSVALGLYPDRWGKAMNNLCRGNVFEGCPAVVGEGAKGLWDATQR